LVWGPFRRRQFRGGSRQRFSQFRNGSGAFHSPLIEWRQNLIEIRIQKFGQTGGRSFARRIGQRLRSGSRRERNAEKSEADKGGDLCFHKSEAIGCEEGAFTAFRSALFIAIAGLFDRFTFKMIGNAKFTILLTSLRKLFRKG
jgi:hypothetical protein